MKFEELNIQDLYIIKPEIISDERGFFRRNFCKKIFKEKNIDFNIKQNNISENINYGTLRGFHYQLQPSLEKKIITVLSGSIYNVTIDLRKNSSTFMNKVNLELNADQRTSVIIPNLCANAFITTSENTIILYHMNDYYNQELYSGFRYDDPYFSIKWPSKPNYISKKDSNYPNFNLEML